MSELSMPGPIPNPESEKFWSDLSSGDFVLQKCQDCGFWQHYPRVICKSCWSDRLDWDKPSGVGTVISFTDVHIPGHPAFASLAPYRLLIVELQEGPRLLSREKGGLTLMPNDKVRAVVTQNPNGPLLLFEAEP
jgi:uncharacterized protein